MKCQLKIVTVVFVVTAVCAEVREEGSSLTRAGHLVAEEKALKGLYLEQLRRSASAEQDRQRLLTEIKERNAARMLLEKDVFMLEAEATVQQKWAHEAPAEAAEVAGTLRRFLQEGHDVVKHASDEVNVARRRLCEALTEDFSDLRVVCRHVTNNARPELAELLDRLEAKVIREAEVGPKTYPTLTMMLLKVLLVCGAWAAAAWVLVPRNKVLKLD